MAKISQTPSMSEVKQVLGETTNSLRELCTNSKINMWAKYKPVRSGKAGNLTETDRRVAQYGLFSKGTNIPTDPQFNAESSFLEYRRPRLDNPDEIKRLKDFKGYNPNAEIFLKDDSEEKRMSFNKVFEMQTSSNTHPLSGELVLNKILISGPNIEIPLSSLNVNITWESYFGLFFYNVTTGAKFYTAYKEKWSELEFSDKSWKDIFPSNVSSNNVGVHSEHFFKTADMYNINKGDVIHVYYCCVPLQFYNSLGSPEPWRNNHSSETYWKDLFNSEEVLYFIDKGLNAIQIAAIAPRVGHGIINIEKFDFTDSNQLDLYDRQYAYDLQKNGKFAVNLVRTEDGTESVASVKVPISLYYFAYLSDYDTSIANMKVHLNIRVVCNGVDLLKQTVTRTIHSSLTEVSGTTPSDGSANFYMRTDNGAFKDTVKVSTSEDTKFQAYVDIINVDGSKKRRLITGKGTLDTGGTQYWSFYS